VHTSQANMTRGKNVIVSDEHRLKMIKLWGLRSEEWQVNLPWQSKARVRPTSSMRLEKYAEKRCKSVFQRLGALNDRGHPSWKGPS
jgi:hypothetical protein